MDTTPQNEGHAMMGFSPPTTSFMSLTLTARIFLRLGHFGSIDGVKYHADYNCSKTTVTTVVGSQTVTPSCRSHQQAGISVGTFAPMAQSADGGFSVD